MAWYPWLNSLYRKMIEHVQSSRVHPVFLLQTLAGMGDAALIWAVSSWLLCRHRQGLKRCKRCHGCQLMQAGTHPDWYLLTAEKDKSVLSVDQVRQLTGQLYRYGQQGEVRVVWLPDANQLSEAATNALLKTLEEPPANCHFFLTSKAPHALLATLRSRCIIWQLMPRDESQSINWLAQQCRTTQERSATALRLSGGAPLMARDLLATEQWHIRDQLCHALALSLQQESMSLLAELDHEAVIQKIDWVVTLFIDTIKWHRRAGQWMQNRDKTALVEQLAAHLTVTQLHCSLALWLSCREQMQQNIAINRELLLTVMLLDWEQIVQTTTSC